MNWQETHVFLLYSLFKLTCLIKTSCLINHAFCCHQMMLCNYFPSCLVLCCQGDSLVIIKDARWVISLSVIKHESSSTPLSKSHHHPRLFTAYLLVSQPARGCSWVLCMEIVILYLMTALNMHHSEMLLLLPGGRWKPPQTRTVHPRHVWWETWIKSRKQVYPRHTISLLSLRRHDKWKLFVQSEDIQTWCVKAAVWSSSHDILGEFFPFYPQKNFCELLSMLKSARASRALSAYMVQALNEQTLVFFPNTNNCHRKQQWNAAVPQSDHWLATTEPNLKAKLNDLWRRGYGSDRCGGWSE